MAAPTAVPSACYSGWALNEAAPDGHFFLQKRWQWFAKSYPFGPAAIDNGRFQQIRFRQNGDPVDNQTMETSLHRQLKEAYADGSAEVEVPLGDYRIDVVQPGLLVEIQHGSLSAIRDKIQKLVEDHRVLVVKPILIERQLIKLDKKGGNVVSRRKSPKTGSLLDVFDELLYFTRVFPHPNLRLEVPLVDVEEWRYPGHGRRRRRRQNDFQVQDRILTGIRETHRFASAADLARMVPPGLPKPFHTGHLAKKLTIDRSTAQRIAYCFRKMGTIEQVGKQGNALLYEFTRRQKMKVVKRRGVSGTRRVHTKKKHSA